MKSVKKIKVIIAEDDEPLRKLYVSLLAKNEEIEVIGEAEDGERLLRLTQILKPDIILTDLEMPVMSGIVAVEKITEKCPTIKIIVISMHTGDVFITQMLIRGVNAYLGKSSDPEEILKAIKQVYEHGFYINQKICKRVVFSSLEFNLFQSVYYQLNLSDKEIAVLKLFCKEYCNKEIAKALNITKSTVEHHKRNIYFKTFTETSIGLVKYSIRKGLCGLT